MRGYAAIGLDNPKDPENIGGVFRAAGCFEASMVVLGGPRPNYLKGLGRIQTDTQKAYRHLPVTFAEHLKDAIPFDCVPVAVDFLPGAKPLPEYVHPERAFYIFGAEDATLGNDITSWCRHRVYIPMPYCMNLAATVNVVLYDRQAKNHRCSKTHQRAGEK